MSVAENFFKNPEEIITWHEKHYQGAHDKYIQLKEIIRKSGFSGSIRLIKNLEHNMKVTDFLSFLTELNLAGLFLEKPVTNLNYEPKSTPGIDFSFDDIALSVKNLHAKDYEKAEQQTIDKLQLAGGGKINIVHKGFSDKNIEVRKTALGTFGWERTETGKNGESFLGSDMDEMSAPLRYMGEFESTIVGASKKVLLLFIQSDEFKQYYVDDIVSWYFGWPNAHPIFQSDMSWYMKLFKQAKKLNNIDAIIFMFAPSTLLAWPKGCLSDESIIDNKKISRVQIYPRNKQIYDQVKKIFV